MKKDIILFSAIFLILSMIATGTYAYWQWVNEGEVTVVFNTPDNIEEYIYYDAGESHFVGNFQPTATHCLSNAHSTISFYLKDGGIEWNEQEYGKLLTTIKLTANAIDPVIASSNYVRWAVTQGGVSDCTSSTLASGNFNNIISGNEKTLISNLEVQKENVCVNGSNISSNCKYTVWLWVDSNGFNLNQLSGKTLDVNVWSQIDMGYVEPGLYGTDGTFTSWDTLVANGDITLFNNIINDSNTVLTGKLIIPDSVTTIGDRAFEDSFLTSVVLGNSVTRIESGAFQRSTLESIVVPNSVTYISITPFSNSSLKHIYYKGTEEEWNAIDKHETIFSGIIQPNIYYNYKG